ncbi:DUF6002 family protein [Actinophytocola sp. NPDC049390]|uniref:DUF6002 family protein n=1 Tax=Actinophytocola sp. NPDC049390 TaxID=3363894 RepID=UPI0037BA4F76
MLAPPTDTGAIIRNLIVDYYDTIAAAAAGCGAEPADAPGTPGFAPAFALPELTDDVREFPRGRHRDVARARRVPGPPGVAHGG